MVSIRGTRICRLQITFSEWLPKGKGLPGATRVSSATHFWRTVEDYIRRYAQPRRPLFLWLENLFPGREPNPACFSEFCMCRHTPGYHAVDELELSKPENGDVYVFPDGEYIRIPLGLPPYVDPLSRYCDDFLSAIPEGNVVPVVEVEEEFDEELALVESPVSPFPELPDDFVLQGGLEPVRFSDVLDPSTGLAQGFDVLVVAGSVLNLLPLCQNISNYVSLVSMMLVSVRRMNFVHDDRLWSSLQLMLDTLAREARESVSSQGDALEFVRMLRGHVEQAGQIAFSPLFKRLRKIVVYLAAYGVLRTFGLTIASFEQDAVVSSAIRDVETRNPINLVYTLVESSLWFAETGLYSWKTGSISGFLHTSANYQRWYDDMVWVKQNKANLHGLGDISVDEAEFLARLDKVIQDGTTIQRFSADAREGRYVMTMVTEMILLKNEVLCKNIARESRDPPFAVLINGLPRVGKTEIVNILFQYLGRLMQKPTDKRFMYSRNFGANFWDGFTSDQWCIWMDDVAFMKPAKGQEDPSIAEIIQVINGAPYTPDQASLEDKGKTPLRASLVLATTNTKDLNAWHYFSCPSAAQRRFPVVINVQPKSICRAEDGGLDNEKLGLCERNNYWEFSVEKPLLPGTHRDNCSYETLVTGADVAGMLSAVRDLYTRHKNNLDEIRISRAEVFSSELCTECVLPLYCCKCTGASQPSGDAQCSSCGHALADCKCERSSQSSDNTQCTLCGHAMADCYEDGCECVDLAREITENPCSACKARGMLQCGPETFCTACGQRNEGPSDCFHYNPCVCEMHFYATQGPPAPLTNQGGKELISPTAYRRMTWFRYFFASLFSNARGTYGWVHRKLKRRDGFFSARVSPELHWLSQPLDNFVSKSTFAIELVVLFIYYWVTISYAQAHWRSFKDRARETLGRLGEQRALAIGLTASFIGGVAAYVYFLRTAQSILVQGGIQSVGEKPQSTESEPENPWKQGRDIGVQPYQVSEHSRTSSPDTALRDISQNTVFARFIANGTASRGRLVGLGGQIYVTLNHVVPDSICMDVEIVQEQAQGPTINRVMKLSHCDIYRDKEKDLALIRLRGLPPKKDVRAWLALEPFDVPFKGKFVYRLSSGVMQHLDLPAIFPGEKYGGVRKVELSYPLAQLTTGGSCGSPILIHTPLGMSWSGVHAAIMGGPIPFSEGDLVDRSGTGCAYFLTRAIIDEMIDASGFQVVPQSGKRSLGSSTAPVHLKTLHRKSEFRFFDEGVAGVFGALSLPRPNRRSAVEPHLLREVMITHGFVVDTYPPIMEGYVPWRLAAEDLLNPVRELDTALLDACEESFFKDILRRLPTAELNLYQVYDVDVAVNGCDGIAFVDRLVRKTSAGHPWNRSKSRFLIQGGSRNSHQDYCELSPEILERVEDIHERYLRGEQVSPVFTCHLKDEPVSQAKRDKGKTRVFSGSPLDWNVVVRMYFLALVRIMQRNRFSFECGPGINACSPEWTNLYRYLCQFGDDKIIAGDYKAFDKRMPAEAILAAFSVLIRLAEAAGASEEAIRVMRCVSYDTAFPMTNFNGTLVQFFGSNPSGHPLTVIINSLVNSLYLRYCYARCGGSLEDFSADVAAMTYGDDNIMGSRVSWFNHTAIQQHLGSIGITYTMADKEAESVPFISINEANFLKRSWRWEERYGMFCAPLAESSIQKSLTTWVRSKSISPEEQAAATLDSACREFWHFGKDRFDVERAFFQEVVDSSVLQHFRVTLPSHEDCLWSFLNGSFQTPPGVDGCVTHLGVETIGRSLFPERWGLSQGPEEAKMAASEQLHVGLGASNSESDEGF